MFDSLKRYRLRNYRFLLILYVSVLTVIGILVIGSAQKSVQSKQIYGFVGGFIIMVFLSLIDYTFILKFKWMMYALMIFLLGLVRVIGSTTGGATRWISIAGIKFQPSEIAKIFIILFFADFLSKYRERLNTMKIMALAILLVAFPLLLIVIQPDLSTTIMTAIIFVTLLFIAGLSYKIILTVLGIIVPVITVGFIYVVQNADKIISSGSKIGYQVMRIMSWIDPTNEKYSSKAIQQQNSIMAIGSGQLWGKGLNNSAATSMKNSNYIMEPQTDFIFTVAGEELGFIGSMIIIGLLILICFECIMIARKSKEFSGRLIACGMATLISFQSIINISVAVGILPNTGIPLPFVSYGLTSLMSLYIGIGIVLNVGLQPKSNNRGGIL
ncbi:MAG: rod shape-determining protein RodA [Agathobacter sp.]|uniref:FtsW/RodA/SpoVE family cell cycle protein n=1 Tax=Agathobacter sp. TaxID=2021311 RepID=UPI00258437EA|nr:FtsW/RodA/SpoVE family cell cycle protein [Agathobacter sp.]MCR5677419.1 rod shape-determining protein RodA [Agathobacter sp.]